MNSYDKKESKFWILGIFFLSVIVAIISEIIYVKVVKNQDYNKEENLYISNENLPNIAPILSFNIPQGKEMFISETIDLEVYQIEDEKKEKINVTYSSSNSKIATVKNNRVTAKSAGSVIITAVTKDGYKVKTNIIIKEKEYLTLNVLDDYEMYKGDSFTLFASLNANNKITTEQVTWSTSNKNIVTVDNGKIIAKDIGKATITAINKDNLKASVKIIVKEKPVKEETTKDTLSLSITKTKTLDVGNTITIRAYRNHNNNSIVEQVVWSSSNASVAQIDNNGIIKALKVGKTTIIATTKDNLKASIEINVIAKPYLSFDIPSPKLLEMSSSFELKVYRNYNGKKTKENVVYTSSNPKIVSVNQNGLIYAHTSGEVTITATSSDGLKQTIQVRVPSPPTITINGCSNGSLELKVGQTKQFTYSFSTSINSEPIWTSSKTDIASINSDGLVTAKKDGTTTITINVGKFYKSCALTISTAYTSSISSTSSIGIDNKINEQLTVTTKNHNNEVVQSGLNYKWYLNNTEIASTSTNTLKINEYGTYRVDVYKDNSKKTTATYTPSATKIAYTMDKSTDTKFVFVNNPEPITTNDFVDNGKVIYKTSFDKNIEMYFEHNRNTSTKFYYGIRIYNPNSQNVLLTINKSGASALYNGTSSYDKVWEEYYTGNITYIYDSATNKYNPKDSYTLSPGQYLYLWLVRDPNMKGNVKFVSTMSNYKYEPYNSYLPSDAVAIDQTWSWAFDGVLNLTAKVAGDKYVSSIGGKLDIANVAVSKDFYKSQNKDAINSASTITAKTGGQLTGEYNGKPIVTNNVQFVIKDSTKSGTLPTRYSTTVDANKEILMNGWVTNLTGSSTTAYQRETIPLTGINSSGNKYTVFPFSTITTANYAVHYHENITITNNSSKSRNVAFYVNSGSGTSSQSANKTLITFVTRNGSIVKSAYKTNNVTIYPTATFGVFSKRTNIQVWRATIPANTSITIPSITLVGGMSYANLVKMVCLDYCYDGFYQQKVSW